MPIYEYKCENGHVFDVMQRMADDPLTECQVCSAPVKKVLQPVGISFKGSGFYSTDYSKKGAKAETKESKETAAKSTNSESNGSSGSESNGSGKKVTEATSSKAKSGD
jgi:putative FmdB family regulatory protein